MQAMKRACVIGPAMVWMALMPSPGWGQSAVWQPQGATTGSIYYNGGNVGIGTTNPSNKLDVFGGLNLRGGGLGVLSWGTDASIYGHSNYLIFLTNGGIERMRIDPSGNLGIGTAVPQYKLAVNGSIGAKDVIVTNSGWSDYVFKPDYRLRPLSDVDKFIQEHHHLPDIPTEAEVKAQGVNVGEMQAKLLAKIEELTLHLIRQEKENGELRERVGKLERRAAER